MIRREKLGAYEGGTKAVLKSQAVEERNTYVCDVCKNHCRLESTTHTEHVAPEWCPFENDLTNLRYSKWRKENEQRFRVSDRRRKMHS